MNTLLKNKLKKRIFVLILFLTVSLCLFIPWGLAQGIATLKAENSAPNLGSSEPILKGIKVHPDNPFHLEFIIDTGTTQPHPQSLTLEATKLIKYFMASLTVPQDELWVNLSPYEKDRIIPEAFGVTEMGRDLLTQDYLLKQITTSLLDPQTALGKNFWDHIYQIAKDKNLPVTTFNKVWIIPDQATVDQNGDTAFVIQSHLKVLLESDYEALQTNSKPEELAKRGNRQMNVETAKIVREMIVPKIEQEVNSGKDFSQLRQVYNSLILAMWFKQNLKDNLLEKIYADKNKTGGIDIEDKSSKERIFQKYLLAYQTGAYNFIKEELDPKTDELIPRKYFSGGFDGRQTTAIIKTRLQSPAATAQDISKTRRGRLTKASVILQPQVTEARPTNQLSASSGTTTELDEFPIVPVLPGEVIFTDKNKLILGEDGDEYDSDHYPGNGHGNNNFIFILGDGSVIRVNKWDSEWRQFITIGPEHLRLIDEMGQLGLSPQLVSYGYARNPDPYAAHGPFFIQQAQIYGEDLVRLADKNNGLLSQADREFVFDLFKRLIDNHYVIGDIEKFDNVMIGTTKYDHTRKAYAHDLDYIEHWDHKYREEIIDFYILKVKNSTGDHSWATADPNHWMISQLEQLRAAASSALEVKPSDLNLDPYNVLTVAGKKYFSTHYPGDGKGDTSRGYSIDGGTFIRILGHDPEGRPLDFISDKQIKLMTEAWTAGLAPEIITYGRIPSHNPDNPGRFFIQNLKISGDDLTSLAAKNGGQLTPKDLQLVVNLITGLINHNLLIADFKKLDNVMIGTTIKNPERKAYAHDLDFIDRAERATKDQLIDFYIAEFGLSTGTISWKSADPTNFIIGELEKLKSPRSSKVGGIDLNPAQLNLKTTGVRIKFNLPADPAEIQQLLTAPFYGFNPVIIHMSPITNLPAYLGISNVSP